MTPEGKVKAAIKRLLDKTEQCYYHFPVQNGMGAPTLDVVGCHSGRFFAIEAKAPGKVPTVRQEGTISRMRDARGQVFVIDGSEESMASLREWLQVT